MIDNTIMEILQNYLPMDLVNIVEEYSKDRTNYNKVVKDLDVLIHECNSELEIYIYNHNVDMKVESFFVKEIIFKSKMQKLQQKLEALKKKTQTT